MCGIVGAVAERNVAKVLLDGLSRLEYRGYDSAGICTIDNNTLNCIKTTGKVKNLKDSKYILMKSLLLNLIFI